MTTEDDEEFLADFEDIKKVLEEEGKPLENDGKLLYCSFCGKSQHEVRNLISGPSVFICDECVGFTVDIIEEEGGDLRIRRTIEFKPEQTQAGLSILSYFSKVVKQKYPKSEVKVKIAQDNDLVSMEIRTTEGEIEKVQHTLDQYGQVVLGRITPESFLSDPLHVMELKNKLELSAMELRMTKELYENTKSLQHDRIKSLEDQVSQLHALVGSGVSQSSELHSLSRALIRISSKDSEIEKAVSVLIERISRGTYSEEDKLANNAISTIANRYPRLLEHIRDIIKGTIGGAGGNIAGSWLMAFINALPK